VLLGRKTSSASSLAEVYISPGSPHRLSPILPHTQQTLPLHRYLYIHHKILNYFNSKCSLGRFGILQVVWYSTNSGLRLWYSDNFPNKWFFSEVLTAFRWLPLALLLPLLTGVVSCSRPLCWCRNFLTWRKRWRRSRLRRASDRRILRWVEGVLALGRVLCS
jgi:hypothetical protein